MPHAHDARTAMAVLSGMGSAAAVKALLPVARKGQAGPAADNEATLDRAPRKKKPAKNPVWSVRIAG